MEDLKLDISEIESFLNQTKRERVRNTLQTELCLMKSELQDLQKQEENSVSKNVDDSSVVRKDLIFEPIKNYSWDQEKPNFVRLTQKRKH